MRILVLCAAAGLVTAPLPAQPATLPADVQTAGDPASEFVPNVRPTLEVRRAPGEIRIDGELEDPGWVGAARATGFSENWPDEQAKPPVESEVWVTYDSDHLYLALIAHDDPSTIRASLRDRDEMWSDDYFGILLDTYGDASWAYYLFANPLGVQGDSRFVSSGGEDDNFDMIYHTAGRVTDSGYVVEMAIPFESLRFPDRPEQEWRATFWRTRPRGSRAQYTWAAMDRDEPCFLCQFGTLKGIRGVKPGGALEIIPSLVASQAGALRDGSDPHSGIEAGSLDADPSLGIRYSFPTGITAEAALNPDFSQVESDAGQIDVNTTFALFFPERRPFFQEGSDLFETFFDAVYTRSINDPSAAGRVTGRTGKSSFAYVGALDEHSPLLLPFEERSFVGQAGKSVTNIARFKRSLYSNSYFGALVTDRRLEGGGSGTTFGADGLLRIAQAYRLEWQLLGSHTREPNDPSLTEGVNGLTFDRGAHTAAFDGESFTGYAQYTSFERSARTWSFDFDYWAYSPTFRADNGFETRNDQRIVSMWQSMAFYPSIGFVDQIRPSFFARRSWNFAGEVKRDIVEPQISFNLKGQSFFNFWYNFGRERFRGVEFDGVRRWGSYFETNFSDPFRFGVFVSRGRSIARFLETPILGTGTDVEGWVTLKPLQRLVIQPTITYSRLSEPDGGPTLFDGYILRTRTSLQFNRELFLRLVVQYNDFAEALSVEPLLTYKINPFTLFFIGSNLAYRGFDEPDVFAHTERQFFAKFQYLLRL